MARIARVQLIFLRVDSCGNLLYDWQFLVTCQPTVGFSFCDNYIAFMGELLVRLVTVICFTRTIWHRSNWSRHHAVHYLLLL